MKKLNVILILLLIISCNVRDRKNANSSGNDYDEKNPFNSNSANPQNDTNEDDDNPTTPPATSVTIPTDASDSCSFSQDGISGYQSNSAHLGEYTLCKSKSNPNQLYIQVRTPITETRLCIIPTYNGQYGSIYIGEPRCLHIPSSTKIEPITMIINRTGYETYLMNSAMIMKDEKKYYAPPFVSPQGGILSPDAYLYCSLILSQTSDPSYCNVFVQVGAYKFHLF